LATGQKEMLRGKIHEALQTWLVTTPGDVNGDGSVNLVDFSTLKENFGSRNALYSEGDLNFNGRVDLTDFAILKRNFGRTLPVAPAATEGNGDKLLQQVTLNEAWQQLTFDHGNNWVGSSETTVENLLVESSLANTTHSRSDTLTIDSTESDSTFFGTRVGFGSEADTARDEVLASDELLDDLFGTALPAVV